jgi:hypothetical protein
MPRAVTIENVGHAFEVPCLEVVKAMPADGLTLATMAGRWRAALAQLLQERKAVAVERHLDRLAELGEPDRRNGSYGRRLLTALGSIELMVPRTRRFSACAVLRAYAGGRRRSTA